MCVTVVQDFKQRYVNYIGKAVQQHFQRLHLLDSKAVHEHDVVPEGSVDIQVNLFDLGGEATSLLLHFLEDRQKNIYLGQQDELVIFRFKDPILHILKIKHLA